VVKLENISEAMDQRAIRVGQMELLRLRLELLEGQERLLVEAYICHRFSFRQLAHLQGTRESKVARQIKGLIQRLLGKEYISIIRSRERFSGEELKVAYDYYLLRLGYRTIAQKRAISEYRVRKVIGRLKRCLEVINIRGQRAAKGCQQILSTISDPPSLAVRATADKNAKQIKNSKFKGSKQRNKSHRKHKNHKII